MDHDVGYICAYNLLFILFCLSVLPFKREKSSLVCFLVPHYSAAVLQEKAWTNILKMVFNELSCLSFFFFFAATCGCLQAVQLLCEHKCPINVKDLVRTSSPVACFRYFRDFTTLQLESIFGAAVKSNTVLVSPWIYLMEEFPFAVLISQVGKYFTI